MYPFVPSRVSTSFHLTISPLYSTIFAPLGIGLLVNRPLPAPGNVDRLTTNCFSSNAMNDECFAFKVEIYVNPCSLVHNACIENGQSGRLCSFKLLVYLLLSVRYALCENR